MNIEALCNIPSWEWPADAGATILRILTDDAAAESDRLLAAEMAGDIAVVNDELVVALIALVRRSDVPDELRGQAAISLGPILESEDIMEFDDPEEVWISEEKFHEVQESLRVIFADADVPRDVRRRILEASVRAAEDWHTEAVQTAYASDDETWRLTAVFCMRFVPGFEGQILEALDSENPALFHQAVCAAGNWGIDAAWQRVAPLATADDIDKDLRLEAIEAIASIRPHEAPEILDGLVHADDEDIAEAVSEALVMAQTMAEFEDMDEEGPDADGDDSDGDEEDRPF